MFTYIRDNSQRAFAAKAVLWCYILYVAFYLMVEIIANEQLYDFAYMIVINENHINLETFLRWSLLLLFYVTFLLWFVRAYHNLGEYGEKKTYKDHGAVSAFFIPVISLFKPYKIAKEIHTGSISFLSGKDVRPLPHLATPTFIGWWWTFWIADLIFHQIHIQLLQFSSYEVMLGAYYFSQVLEIAAWIMTLVFVIRMNSLENMMFLYKDAKDIGLELTGVTEDTNTEKEEEEQDQIRYNAPRSSAPGSNRFGS